LQAAQGELEAARDTLERAIAVLKEKEPGSDLVVATYQLCIVYQKSHDREHLIQTLKDTIGLARHLRDFEMEKTSTEMLAVEDPQEWLKMMNAPLVGAVTEELKTER